jgi:hypothetical protein
MGGCRNQKRQWVGASKSDEVVLVRDLSTLNYLGILDQGVNPVLKILLEIFNRSCLNKAS